MHYSLLFLLSTLSFSFVRDVSSVELLQKYHQGIRSEIETRSAKFTDCIDLGKSMLTRKHRDSAEVRMCLNPAPFLLFALDLITFLGTIIPKQTGLPEKEKKN